MHEHVHRSRPVETDSEGKFQIDEVIPGVKFTLRFIIRRGARSYAPAKKLERTASAGKPLDLGDVKVELDAPTRGE
jgi:hypothetical protein